METAQRATNVTVTKETIGKKDVGQYFVRQVGKPVLFARCQKKPIAYCIEEGEWMQKSLRSSKQCVFFENGTAGRSRREQS